MTAEQLARATVAILEREGLLDRFAVMVADALAASPALARRVLYEEFTVKQVAALKNVSERTVWRAIRKGKLRCEPRGNGEMHPRRVVRREDAEAYRPG